jgi:uncharacterized protein
VVVATAHKGLAKAAGLALSKDSLQLIIFPTEKCNFRCTYCYEDFSIGRMQPKVQQALKNFILRAAPRLSKLQLNWFGGEPLLVPGIVKDISAYAQQVAMDHGLHSFGGNLTTNGYLLNPSLFRELLQLQQTSYQISLDGYGEGHDVTRKSASGAGTFDVIWSNLLAARGFVEEFSILLRVHVTPTNRDSVARLVDEIAVQFAGDRRFTVLFKAIGNYGGPNSHLIKTIPLAEMVSFIPRLQSVLTAAKVSNMSVTGSAESDTGSDDEVPYICYASKPNSFVVRSNGSIGKCTVALYDPRNCVGTLTEDGGIELNRNVGLWMRGFKDFDLDALGCPLTGLPPVANPQVATT